MTPPREFSFDSSSFLLEEDLVCRADDLVTMLLVVTVAYGCGEVPYDVVKGYYDKDRQSAIFSLYRYSLRGVSAAGFGVKDRHV